MSSPVHSYSPAKNKIQAHCQVSNGMDGHWSQIVRHGMGVGQHLVLDRQKPSLEWGVGGLLLQTGYHLSLAFTIAVWMDVPSSHLPSSSLRGWLLATGEGRQKSATKSCSVSKWYGIWMHYLKADGSMACNGAPGRRSQLFDSDELGSCSHLIAGPRWSRFWHSASNIVFGISNIEAIWSAAATEATGGWSLSLPIICPLTPELSSSRCSIICSC